MKELFAKPALQARFKDGPLVLVDVGASGGIPPRWRAAEPHLRVVGFDADDRAADPGAFLGLDRVPGEKDFFQTRKQECSSFLKPNRAFLDQFPEADRFDVVKTVRVRTDTVDAQLAARGVKDADFLKVDTQGTELFVLEGARRTLETVFGLEVEVEFSALYEGQPLFADVDTFLQSMGFRLFDLKPQFWKRKGAERLGGPQGQMVFGDALYFRAPAAFAASPAKTLRAAAVCLLYGYRDYALAVTESCAALGADERAALNDVIRSGGWNSRVPAFPGRWRISTMVHALWTILRPTAGGWGWSGKDLGNP